MSHTESAYERWVWLELIGFDNRQEDLGVQEYLDTLGFVPNTICLLLSSVDLILLHERMKEEKNLPPDVCSREGHEHNQDRKRQVWTNHQLRNLISRLHDRGVEVFVSVFAQYHHNRHHQEWASGHPEVRALYARLGRRGGINSLSRLRDGSRYEDFFLKKLLEVLRDYGFDGWHGCDGYGPLSGSIYDVDVSDDMVNQFTEATGVRLPDPLSGKYDDDPEKLKLRIQWIWRNKRREWIDFYTDRWAAFWKKMVSALHRESKKAVINSSWGRAPFESLYRYGIDYKKIAATGVDGIVVESVAAGLCMDPRGSDPSWHYDFLSMLMLIKAYVPDTKLIFLHNTHDIVEQWDALRHAPTVLEREIYSLANVYHSDADGKLRRCADGFMVCLGDGIRPEEWRWLRERWELAFAPVPRRTMGATLVWSDAALRNQINDFTNTRTWTTHRLLFHLMERGAPVQTTMNVHSLDKASGPVLVLNPHLFADTELKKVFSYKNGPIVAVGPRTDLLPVPDFQLEDLYPPHELRCAVYGLRGPFNARIQSEGPEELPADFPVVTEPAGYWDRAYFRKVSKSFLEACAKIILKCADCVTVTPEPSDAEEIPVTVMMMEQGQGQLRLAVKSKISVYAYPQLDLGKPIEGIRVLTRFPMMLVKHEGCCFRVKVPPKGIVVLDIRFKASQNSLL